MHNGGTVRLGMQALNVGSQPQVSVLKEVDVVWNFVFDDGEGSDGRRAH